MSYGRLQRGELDPLRCGLIDPGGLDRPRVRHDEDVVVFELPTREVAYRLLELSSELTIGNSGIWFAVQVVGCRHPTLTELAVVYPDAQS